ncbi:MAG: hypothetical protein Q7S86_00700 [bacterium]|nr:hypothetical protein [bacterium]
MEKSNDNPWVPPESGPEMFQRMREQVTNGDLPIEPLKTEKSPQIAAQKAKKPEEVAKNRPALKTPKFRNGASAMDEWQREKETLVEKRFKKAA